MQSEARASAAAGQVDFPVAEWRTPVGPRSAPERGAPSGWQRAACDRLVLGFKAAARAGRFGGSQCNPLESAHQITLRHLVFHAHDLLHYLLSVQSRVAQLTDSQGT